MSRGRPVTVIVITEGGMREFITGRGRLKASDFRVQPEGEMKKRKQSRKELVKAKMCEVASRIVRKA